MYAADYLPDDEISCMTLRLVRGDASSRCIRAKQRKADPEGPPTDA